MVTGSFPQTLMSGSVGELPFSQHQWGRATYYFEKFPGDLSLVFCFFCFQIWGWLYNRGTNSRVQPWPEACAGVLWTCLSRQCPQGEAPEHATVPASILTVLSGQDIQHPFPEQEETPHRRLLCFSDNTWPSKHWMSKPDWFFRVKIPDPSPPLPLWVALWAAKLLRLEHFWLTELEFLIYHKLCFLLNHCGHVKGNESIYFRGLLWE